MPSKSAITATEHKTELVSALLSISKSTRALTQLKLQELGFHNGQDELLLALDERVSTSVSKVADALCVRPSTVSKMMDRLVERGMVQRVKGVSDQRQTMVRITPAGLDARSRLLAMREKLEKELVAAFAGDAEAIIQTLDTVAQILRARLMRLR
ncbi:hypothetical protein ASG43_17690 [Aureimonas sp. Leaf454]|nr:hypothetical protein ASG43_17690 [Aureimonas sp. Leaf454]